MQNIFFTFFSLKNILLGWVVKQFGKQFLADFLHFFPAKLIHSKQILFSLVLRRSLKKTVFAFQALFTQLNFLFSPCISCSCKFKSCQIKWSDFKVITTNAKPSIVDKSSSKTDYILSRKPYQSTTTTTKTLYNVINVLKRIITVRTLFLPDSDCLLDEQ